MIFVRRPGDAVYHGGLSVCHAHSSYTRPQRTGSSIRKSIRSEFCIPKGVGKKNRGHHAVPDVPKVMLRRVRENCLHPNDLTKLLKRIHGPPLPRFTLPSNHEKKQKATHQERCQR
jgi:hypothetical protein